MDKIDYIVRHDAMLMSDKYFREKITEKINEIVETVNILIDLRNTNIKDIKDEYEVVE